MANQCPMAGTWTLLGGLLQVVFVGSVACLRKQLVERPEAAKSQFRPRTRLLHVLRELLV